MSLLPKNPVGLLRALRRRFGSATGGGWGMASSGSATATACVDRQAAGRLRLKRLRVLSATGDAPARRISDLAATLRKPAVPCAMLMPAEDYQVMFMPGLPVAQAERTQALHWRLKDDLEFPSDEAVIECVTVATQAPGNQHELWMVVVARRRRVYELIAPLRAAGVVIEAADIAELAQRNLAMQCAPAGRTVAMLPLDSQRGMLTISRDDGMYATRQLDPIAVALASEDEDRRESLIERLALELQRTFDNVERQYGAGPIDRVIVQCDQFTEAVLAGLARDLPVPVQALRLADFLDSADPALLEVAAHSTLATLAIGAALRFDPEPLASDALKAAA